MSATHVPVNTTSRWNRTVWILFSTSNRLMLLLLFLVMDWFQRRWVFVPVSTVRFFSTVNAFCLMFCVSIEICGTHWKQVWSAQASNERGCSESRSSRISSIEKSMYSQGVPFDRLEIDSVPFFHWCFNLNFIKPIPLFSSTSPSHSSSVNVRPTGNVPCAPQSLEQLNKIRRFTRRFQPMDTF